MSDTALSSTDWRVIPNWVNKTTGGTFEQTVSETDQHLKLFQTILDRISAAFLSVDVEAWLNASSLPFQLVTRQGVQTFSTEEEMRRVFEV